MPAARQPLPMQPLQPLLQVSHRLPGRYRWLEQARDPSAPPKFKELALAVDAARLAVRSLPAKNHAPIVSCALQMRAHAPLSHGGPAERRFRDESQSHALSLSSSSSNDSFAVSDARTARCIKSVHSASDTSSCSSYSPPRGCLHVSERLSMRKRKNVTMWCRCPRLRSLLRIRLA